MSEPSNGMPVRQVFAAYERDQMSADAYRFCPLCGAELAEDATHEPPRHRCPDCHWIHYRNPSPGVTVLIVDGDRVLLGKRGADSFAPGQWCLPGGFIEFEEDYLTAARREVLEETGLEVRVTGIVNVATKYLSPTLHTLVPVVKAEIVGGEATPGDDLVALEWVPLEGPLPEMAFEADRYVIERAARDQLPHLPVQTEEEDL